VGEVGAGARCKKGGQIWVGGVLLVIDGPGVGTANRNPE
jgi:hypothetical protein